MLKTFICVLLCIKRYKTECNTKCKLHIVNAVKLHQDDFSLFIYVFIPVCIHAHWRIQIPFKRKLVFCVNRQREK